MPKGEYTHIEIPADDLDRAKRFYSEVFGWELASMGGFEDYLVDAGNGVVVSISLFGDRDAAEESTRRAAEWVSWNLADLIRLPPQVLTGEVVAQRTTEHTPLA